MSDKIMVTVPEDVNQAIVEAGGLIKSSMSIVVKSHEEAETASGLRRNLKTASAFLEDERKKLTTPLDTQKKNIMDWFRKPQDAITTAIECINKKVQQFNQEEMARLLAIQRKLEAEAKEKEEKEKARLGKLAVKAEARGDTEKADALRERQEDVCVPFAIVDPPKKVGGISYRDNWSVEIIDESLIPREWLMPNIPALTKLAVATKGVVQIPGVKMVCIKTVVGR